MPESEQAPYLSVIIPAFNESLRLPHTLTKIGAYLKLHKFCAEVLVVDDGSTDDTAAFARAQSSSSWDLRVITTTHLGKGHAIRTGLLASQGAIAFLCDADLSMPITELDRFLAAHLSARDIAIASREAAGAQRFNEPLYRHVMGRIFNTFVRWTVLPGIQDSQCGFKWFPGPLARALARVQTLDGWGFDVELLAIARAWGYHVVEIPIAWYHVRSSHIRPLHDAWQMAREVLTVRRNLHHGVYGSPVSGELSELVPSEGS